MGSSLALPQHTEKKPIICITSIITTHTAPTIGTMIVQHRTKDINMSSVLVMLSFNA